VTAAIPTVVHEPWCDPDRHDHGPFDSVCHAASRPLIAAISSESELNVVEVGIERSADRPGGRGDWQVGAPTVMLHVLGETHEYADLTPAEARVVAHDLLLAADAADGRAVNW